jgi:hypothetical protein
VFSENGPTELRKEDYLCTESRKAPITIVARELSTAKRSDERIVNYAKFRKEAAARRKKDLAELQRMDQLRSFTKVWKSNF